MFLAVKARSPNHWTAREFPLCISEGCVSVVVLGKNVKKKKTKPQTPYFYSKEYIPFQQREVTCSVATPVTSALPLQGEARSRNLPVASGNLNSKACVSSFPSSSFSSSSAGGSDSCRKKRQVLPFIIKEFRSL